MSNAIGEKVKEFRVRFNMSQKQATKALGGISHSAWAYWEGHGCPLDRLAAIAKMTTDAKVTYDWLTSTGNGKMPESIELIKPIPAGSGTGTPRKKKKPAARRYFSNQDRANILAAMRISIKEGGTIIGFCNKHRLGTSMAARWGKLQLPPPNGAGVPGIVEPGLADTSTPPSTPAGNVPVDRGGKRMFTPQHRANILADMRRTIAEGDTVDGYSSSIGLGHSVIAKWLKMDLPAPNGEAVPGVIDAAPQSGSQYTNLPQEPLPPPRKPGPKPSGRGGYHPPKVSKAKALITSQYLCPHCGSPVFLPEE